MVAVGTVVTLPPSHTDTYVRNYRFGTYLGHVTQNDPQSKDLHRSRGTEIGKASVTLRLKPITLAATLKGLQPETAHRQTKTTKRYQVLRYRVVIEITDC